MENEKGASDREDVGMNSDVLAFLRLAYKWRLYIAVFLILSCGLGVLISSSLFMTPLFKSETIIYPSNTNTNNHLISTGLRFGSDKELDEQMQLLTSNILRDSIIKKYDLAAHYGIDTGIAEAWSELHEEFADNVGISRTRYN
nr:hypothetical protein [Bacteroidota bacterium]